MKDEHKEMLSIVVKMLEKDNFKKHFLNELNNEVDIPFVGEKKEGKIFKALYKVLIKSLSDLAEDDDSDEK
tara:strand:+ start:1883 stop:2095 length:213 start_codon:yes stop_codon:yes gene_type:complete